MKVGNIKIYRLLLLIFTWIIFIAPSVCLSMEKEIIEKEYNLNQTGKINFKNTSGDISVDSWQKNKIKLIATKIAKNKSALNNAAIEIDSSEDAIWITSKQKKKLGLFHSNYTLVHFQLLVPDKAQIKIESTNGSTIAKNIGSFIEVKSICGNVNIQNAINGVKIKTISGKIVLKNINGDVNLKTTSGAISITGMNGSLEAENVSGRIDLNNIADAKHIEVESIAGNISLNGGLNPAGSYELDSHCGNITLNIPEYSNFELQTKTFSGEVQYNFNIKNIGKVSSQKFHGISGKGGANLTLSSFSGNIQIEKE